MTPVGFCSHCVRCHTSYRQWRHWGVSGGVEEGCWSEGGSRPSLGFDGGTAFWKQKGWPWQVRGLVIAMWPKRLFSCGCIRGTICRSEGGSLGERDKRSANLEDLVFRLCGSVSTKAGTKGPISQTVSVQTGRVACLLDPRDCGGQRNLTGYLPLLALWTMTGFTRVLTASTF